MSDEHERQNSALISAVRQLPARITLVNRGIALAERLLARERELEIVLPNLREMSGVPEEHIKVLVGPVDIDEAIATWVPADAGGECVLDWLKNEGDTVTAGEPLAEVRGEFGPSIPLPSPVDGVLTEIVAKRGVVPLGSVVAFVQASRFAKEARDITEVPASEELFDEEDGRILLEWVEEISAKTLSRQGEKAPVIKLVNMLLMSAIERVASEIHIEPSKNHLSVRYRIDGFLYDIMSPPLKFRDAITACIKEMSKLNIEERQRPQQGRIGVRFRNNRGTSDIDFLVSCHPTQFGEKIVISIGAV